MKERAETSNAKFINPPNRLKAMVGSGGINMALIEKAQKQIEQNNVDLTPIIETHLETIDLRIKDLETQTNHEHQEDMINSIMQIKANGAMFNYPLVSQVAAIGLSFIEAIETINQDALEVMKAHHTTITLILKRKLSGKGGPEGIILLKELQAATNRYFNKYT